MSWDVWIEVAGESPEVWRQTLACGTVAVDERGSVLPLGRSLNYTHNLNQAMRHVVPGFTLWDHDGNLCQSVAGPVQDVSDRLLADLETLSVRFNPANGWGDVEGAARFLSEIARVCRLHPEATFRVSG